MKLTNEERLYAAIHHDLIYRFLRKHRLEREEYYDVVAPAYLRAVRRYWSEEELRQYQFSTIAWGAMRSSVGTYRKKLNRQKRRAKVASLDQRYQTGRMPAAEGPALADPDDWVSRLESRIMLMDLIRKLTKEQREILSMKVKGYCMREIAQRQKRTPSRIRTDMEQIREALRPLQNAV